MSVIRFVEQQPAGEVQVSCCGKAREGFDGNFGFAKWWAAFCARFEALLKFDNNFGKLVPETLNRIRCDNLQNGIYALPQN